MPRSLITSLALALSLVVACSATDERPSNPAGDETAAGDAAGGGDTLPGDAAAGDVTAGDPLGGDGAVGDSAPGDTLPLGDPARTGDEPAGGDAGLTLPLAGFGSISGACDVIDDEEIFSPNPSLFRLAIDFGLDPYDAADFGLLSAGGQQIVLDDNAGGSSLDSEIFAYEVLYRCELAALLKTETFVVYEPPEGGITDLLVEIDGSKIGVSVTRAMSWPLDDPYSVQQATDLLERKLLDVQESSAHVAPGDAWVKQILFVMAYGPGHADSVETAYGLISPTIKADTILVVTVSDGDDAFIY